jgi:hypothetical protein
VHRPYPEQTEYAVEGRSLARLRISLFREHWFRGTVNGHFAREQRYRAVNTRDGLAVLEAVKGRLRRNPAGSSP